MEKKGANLPPNWWISRNFRASDTTLIRKKDKEQ